MSEEVDNYLEVYRAFVENFLNSIDEKDQLPVKIAKYNIIKSELVGAVLDWTFQLLNQWDCPQSFTISIYKLVFKEIKELCDVQPNVCGYDSNKEEFESLKLMKTVISKILEVCKRLKDEKSLASLPKPECSRFVSMYAIKNHRRFMEDRYIGIDNLDTLFELKDYGPISYYAVFDGHNGTDAAAYGCSHLHQYLVDNANYPHRPFEALRQAFLDTDNYFLQKCRRHSLRSGSTALCVLIHHYEKMLYAAWAGDSEAVLVRRGKVIKLVNPHKADREDERNRIKDLGGTVLFWSMAWRVFGQLAVSRAIGNQEYKPFVTSEPDIISMPLDGSEDFVILACDGLWDHVSPRQAAEVVYKDILCTNGVRGLKKVKKRCLRGNAGNKERTDAVETIKQRERTAARANRKFKGGKQIFEGTS